jgi:hypothetical protein
MRQWRGDIIEPILTQVLLQVLPPKDTLLLAETSLTYHRRSWFNQTSRSPRKLLKIRADDCRTLSLDCQ